MRVGYANCRELALHARTSLLLAVQRLFDIDLFNIHFGTPSKMNEALLRVRRASLRATERHLDGKDRTEQIIHFSEQRKSEPSTGGSSTTPKRFV